MLLTDPEVESSLLISLDEGASYQKYSLAFDILSLLFHPEQEDWILAYSHDQKVMYSVRAKYVTERKKKKVLIEGKCDFYSRFILYASAAFFFGCFARFYITSQSDHSRNYCPNRITENRFFSHLRGFKQ